MSADYVSRLCQQIGQHYISGKLPHMAIYLGKRSNKRKNKFPALHSWTPYLIEKNHEILMVVTLSGCAIFFSTKTANTIQVTLTYTNDIVEAIQSDFC